jgi:hypothetical protein
MVEQRSAVRVSLGHFAVQPAEFRGRCLAVGEEHAGHNLGAVVIRVRHELGFVAEHRGCDANVAGRRADRDPRRPAGRIGGRQRAILVEQEVDDRALDLESPRLSAVHRRRANRGRE